MGTTFNYDVVIVGAGPAGMCAGMYAGRSMLKTVVASLDYETTFTSVARLAASYSTPKSSKIIRASSTCSAMSWRKNSPATP